MISPEFTPYESAQILEAMVEGVARSFPMQFTLRFQQWVIPHHNGEESHRLRTHFHAQLADYWERDWRLKKINKTLIKPALRSQRFPRGDSRRQELGGRIKTWDQIYRSHKIGKIRFVPLVTRWRYLRCELAIRIYRYEGVMEMGGLLDHNGDLDNKCKTITDALRVPDTNSLPKAASHAGLFFVVLEDDRLVEKITMETRNILGPRPAHKELVQIDADIDVRIYPLREMGTVNPEMLYP